MKNISLLFIFLFCLPAIAQSQKPTMEAFVNYNYTMPLVNSKFIPTQPPRPGSAELSATPSYTYDIEINSNGGFSLGTMLEFKLKKRKNIDFLSGIEFTFLRYKITHTQVNAFGTSPQNLTSESGKRTSFGQITLPMDFRFKHSSGFYAKLGISVDILLFVREKYLSLIVNPSSFYYPWTIGDTFSGPRWEEYEVVDKSRENFNDANISSRISLGYQINDCLSFEIRHRRKLGSVYKELDLAGNNKVSLNLNWVEFGMNLGFGNKKIEAL